MDARGAFLLLQRRELTGWVASFDEHVAHDALLQEPSRRQLLQARHRSLLQLASCCLVVGGRWPLRRRVWPRLELEHAVSIRAPRLGPAPPSFDLARLVRRRPACLQHGLQACARRSWSESAWPASVCHWSESPQIGRRPVFHGGRGPQQNSLGDVRTPIATGSATPPPAG